MANSTNPSSQIDEINSVTTNTRSYKLGRRFEPKASQSDHWVKQVADAVEASCPSASVWTCASGVSPSGRIHFGNLREIVTPWLVYRELTARGHNTRYILSWDDFDRFVKVPGNLPPTLSEHIGKPLSEVPDPFGEYPSYAIRFERELEESLVRLGIEPEYRYQAQEYGACRYVEGIVEALSKRELIADILLSFMSEKAKAQKGIDPERYRESFFPVLVYSPFTGTDATEVIAYDGGTVITCRCCTSNRVFDIDFASSGRVKLPYKVDWPMRWRHEKVVFEPAGLDHATPGSTFDVASVISREVFNHEPPLFVEYKFVKLRGTGGKMSSSRGNTVTPGDLLEIYEPSLLLWQFTKRHPSQEFSVALDSEVIRQYDEFDRELNAVRRDSLKTGSARLAALQLANANVASEEAQLPFRQVVALGQIVQWQLEKVRYMCTNLGIAYSDSTLRGRLDCARAWLERYNQQDRVILRDSFNEDHWRTMSDGHKRLVVELVSFIRDNPGAEPRELEGVIYSIPKDENASIDINKERQRAFFVDLYMLLLGSDTGPRLSTFLWALDRSVLFNLLVPPSEKPPI